MSLDVVEHLKAVNDFFKFTVKSISGTKGAFRNVSQIKANIIAKYDELKAKLHPDLRGTLEKRDSYLRRAFQMLTEDGHVENDIDSEDENMIVEDDNDEEDDKEGSSDCSEDDEEGSSDCSEDDEEGSSDSSDEDDEEGSSDSSEDDECDSQDELNENKSTHKLKEPKSDKGCVSPNKSQRKEDLTSALQQKIRSLEEQRGKHKMTENVKSKLLLKRKIKHDKNKKSIKRQKMEKKKNGA